MELENIFDTQRRKLELVEWRGRIEKDQLETLKYWDDVHGIPQGCLST